MPAEPAPELRQGFPFVVGYVGIMGPEDGILEMVDVVRDVVDRQGRRDVLFVFVGDGASRDHARRQFVTAGLDAYVSMPGMIRDGATLQRYLATFDVCVSPEPLTPLNAHSTFIKVGEYMSMGKPVVAFDLMETRRTAADAATYAAPGDIQGFASAIVALLDQPETRRRMGTTGRRRIEDELAWEHQACRLVSAYDQLLNGPARSVADERPAPPEV
ncbi:MAG: hypothetical protein NVSMB42_26200 [Herpetosiphon sp.]